ncbi:hypothetical protein [Stappia indica]|uniref:hypothetical protein n=1 Tax=Stappia indica TaxID=538381 RepID=UPI001CD3E704|nr:hypothetical protein [Stappia indica]MCA1297822.1 hypothetical protein [Stappia indica]
MRRIRIAAALGRNGVLVGLCRALRAENNETYLFQIFASSMKHASDEHVAASTEAGRLTVIEVPDFRARLSVWLLSGGAHGSLAYAFSALETAV